MRIIVIFFFLVILGSCSYSDSFYYQLESILGVNSVSFENEFKKDEFLSFSGEGYSINVLNLSDITINEFLNSVDKAKYPVYRNGFKTIRWKKTPMSPEFKETKELVIKYFVQDTKRKNYQREIAEVMNSNDAYYSFYYKSVEDNILEIVFFLVDVKTKKMYIVNNKI
jgi:hypothetical protein